MKLGMVDYIQVTRDLLLKFWDPLNITETDEAINVKFGTEMDGSEY